MKKKTLPVTKLPRLIKTGKKIQRTGHQQIRMRSYRAEFIGGRGREGQAREQSGWEIQDGAW